MSGAMQANEQETANPGKRDEVPSESECSKGNANTKLGGRGRKVLQ